MDRQEANNLLAQLVFGELEEPTRTQLLQYLAQHPDLQQQYLEMKQAAQLLEEGLHAEPAPSLSDERRSALLTQVAAEAAGLGSRWGAFFLRPTTLSMAAALVLAGLVMAWVSQIQKTQEDQPVVALTESSDGLVPAEPGRAAGAVARARSIEQPVEMSAPASAEAAADRAQALAQPSAQAPNATASADFNQIGQRASDGSARDADFSAQLAESAAVGKSADERQNAQQFGFTRPEAEVSTDRLAATSVRSEAQADHDLAFRKAASAPVPQQPNMFPHLSDSSMAATAAAGGKDESRALQLNDSLLGRFDPSPALALAEDGELKTKESAALGTLRRRQLVAPMASRSDLDSSAKPLEPQDAAPAPPPAGVDQRAHPAVAAGRTDLYAEPPFPQEKDLPARFAPHAIAPAIDTAHRTNSAFVPSSSTFSFDLARNWLSRGLKPPAESVRVEEYINAALVHDAELMAQNHDADSHAIHIAAQLGPSPLQNGPLLLKLEVGAADSASVSPTHRVLVVDCSASMAASDRLPLLQRALASVLPTLDPRDRVTLIAAGATPTVILDAKPVRIKQEITAAVRSLDAAGPTDLMAALDLGLHIAARPLPETERSQLILVTEGAANAGRQENADILASVMALGDQPVAIDVLGVAPQAINDDLLNSLAARTGGRYRLLAADQPPQIAPAGDDTAVRVLQNLLLAPPTASDVKAQVTFDPAVVARYRLLGYSRRYLAPASADTDGESAAGAGITLHASETAVAMYELELQPGIELNDAKPLGRVQVHYRDESAHRWRLIEEELPAPARSAADPHLQLAACAALIAEHLQQAQPPSNLASIRQRLVDLAQQPTLQGQPQVQRLIDLIDRWSEISRR